MGVCSLSPSLSGDLGGDSTSIAVVTPAGRHDFPAATSVPIDRDESSDVQLDHPFVPRQHARLDRVGGGWRLTNLSSSVIVKDGVAVLETIITAGSAF